MLRRTKTFHVAAEPDAVFRYVVDPDIAPPGVKMTMAPVHETAEGVGSVYEWSFRMLGVRWRGVTVYTEYVPGERIRFRDFGVIEDDNVWIIAPEDGGSQATVEVNLNLRIPLLGRLLEPLLLRQMEKALKAMIAEIERQASRVPAAA